MKRKYRGLSLIVTVFMLCMSMSFMVHAEDESVWTFDTEYWFLKGYEGAGGDVAVPEQIQGCPVTFMTYNTLSNSDAITSIKLSGTTEAMGSGCCSYNPNMISVTLPDSLMAIGPQCFMRNDQLAEVTIPAQVAVIEDYSFSSDDALMKITFLGECPVIAPNAVNWLPTDCVVYVPDDQLEAYQAVFAQNDNDIIVQPSGQNAIPREPVYDNDNLVIDESGMITEYNGYNVRLDIPEELNGIKVTGIGPNVFEMHFYLAYVTLPEGVTTIGESSFDLAQYLLYVKLPSTVKEIGPRAFYNAYHGSDIEWPESLESIGSDAFYSNYLSGNVVFPEGLKRIEANAFKQAYNVEELYLPSTIEYLGPGAFSDCSFNYALIPSEKVPEIDPTAFEECYNLADIDLYTHATKQDMLDLQSKIDDLGLSCRVWRIQNPDVDYAQNQEGDYIRNPDGTDTVYFAAYEGDQTNIRPYDNYSLENSNYLPVTGVADGALKGNQTVKYFAVCYNDELTYIGAEAFADSALEKVDLFDSVTTIGDGAFRNCTGLTELTLPESVTSIGAGAFEGCTGLEKVTIDCDMSALPEGTFAGLTNLKEVKLGSGAIPARTFENTGITSIDLSANVSVGDRSFAGTGITELALPETLTDIGAGAFEGTAITEVTFPESVTSIGAGAFADCASLAAVNLTDAVTAIGAGAWDGTAISSFVIPASVPADASAIPAVGSENIRISDAASDEQVAAWTEALAFPWYDKLCRVSEESSFVKMPYEATPEEYFVVDADTGMLKEYKGPDENVVIPRSVGGVAVTGISYNCFESCRDYTDTEMTTNETSWTHMRTVVIPETVTVIEDNAFGYCQQLETCVCYAPLETTGRGVFATCRNLKNVIFVNPVKQLDNWLFDDCRSLENVWYPGTLDRIGESCFNFSGIKTFIADAKMIANAAFSHCSQLEELHVRGSLEQMITSCIGGCEQIKKLCFETTSVEGMDASNGTGCMIDIGTVVVIPPEATDEEAQNFYNKWCAGNLGPVTDPANVHREACSVPETPEMPDIDALLGGTAHAAEAAAEGIPTPAPAPAPETETMTIESTEVTMPETEAAVPETDPAAPETEAAEVSVEEGQAPTERLEVKYVCTSADIVDSGVTIQASALGGGEYAVTFHQDGTAEFVLVGTPVPGLSWTYGKVQTDDGEKDAFVMNYLDGTPYVFICTDAGLDMNFYGSMLMHFEVQ